MLTSINIYFLIGVVVISSSVANGIRITSLEVPSLLQNGSGPVEFICIFKLLNSDTGLVINWYHNMEKIYEWIPPLAPKDMGIIKGLVDYPWENINRPHSHSILRINTITTNLAGEYSCSVSTFQGKASKSAKLIVYVPVNKVKIGTTIHNETHLNISCEAFGAHPPPKLNIFLDGINLEGETEYTKNYNKNPWIRHQIFTRQPENSSLIDCEIMISEVDYKRREKLFYYPCSDYSSSLVVSYLNNTNSCMNFTSTNEPKNTKMLIN